VASAKGREEDHRAVEGYRVPSPSPPSGRDGRPRDGHAGVLSLEDRSSFIASTKGDGQKPATPKSVMRWSASAIERHLWIDKKIAA
jgi:hypothetical protein